ncbi:MAG TPA: SHD1 domain-containing protein, partial [Thermoguttaceae bacterium]|nr:SHD1 domain-containing protein [Thermoguttaceae bacterium]
APAFPPMEEPAAPIEEPVAPMEEAAPVFPPMEEPAATIEEPAAPIEEPAAPVEQPALDPTEDPAAEPIDDDPFAQNGTSSLRLWTDISGKYHVEARLVSVTDGTVRLQKTDGRYVRIVMDKLCLVDQQFVGGQIETIAAAR